MVLEGAVVLGALCEVSLGHAQLVTMIRGKVLTSACMNEPCTSRSSRFVTGAVQRPVAMYVGFPLKRYQDSGPIFRPDVLKAAIDDLGSWK